MRSIIFIAPPAAGKGTQAELVRDKYGIPHISTGELLRGARNSDDECSKTIAKMQDEGKLVPDELVLELLKERFPRNIKQAKEYEKILSDIYMELGYVILIDLAREIAEKRISGRLSCPKCGSVYNSLIECSKPKVENTCNNCKSQLIHRNDDDSTTYGVRYQTYLNDTAPLIDYYRDKNVLYHVNGNTSKEEIFNEIVAIIENNK